MPTDPLTLASPPLFLAADIRAIDRAWATAHPGTSLMERAGASAADLAQRLADNPGRPILIVAGLGNNGGDALVAARWLKTRGIAVTVASRADTARLPSDAAKAWAAWQACGGTVRDTFPADARFSLVVDGLFGVGLQRDVEGEEARWIGAINALPCPRLALDVPSGLDADRGTVRGCAVRADDTLTLIGLKPGLYTGAGRDYAGTIHLDTLGAEALPLPATAGVALTGLESRHALPPRHHDSHKGNFGRVGVVGGAPGMVGAPLLAGRAALGQGAGTVTVAVLDERVAIDYGEPRLMFAVAEALVAAPLSVLALGPGLGTTPRAHALVEAASTTPASLVLDADALNLLASDPALAAKVSERRAPTVLTPHPGEAARLLHTSTEKIQAHRIDAARGLSQTFNAVVVLKGSGSVIARPDGHYAVNTSGGPWLAQAGSGDRLTGLIAGRLAQRLSPENAVESAVWLHGAERPGDQQRDFR